MTENEAIKEIETSLELAEMCTPNREREKEIKAYKMAIQALEEIQQYRAIGTVEEVQTQITKSTEWLIERDTRLAEYQAIGTIEELKALKEKSVAKKPIQQETTEKTHYKCPCCNNIMQTIYKDGVAWGHIANYCERCGQKIDCKLPAN